MKAGFLVVLLLAVGVNCAILYVSPSGTDVAGCGGVSNQCKTITYAMGTAGIGDTINVEAGTYVEDIVIMKEVSIIGISNVVLNGKISSHSAYLTWNNVRIEGITIELADTMLEFVTGTVLNNVEFNNVGFMLNNDFIGKKIITKFHGYIPVDNLVFKGCTFSTGTYLSDQNNPFQFRYSGGPLVFDGCHVTGYCRVNNNSAQMNIVQAEEATQNLTVANGRTSYGGNYYFFHMNGLYVHDNTFEHLGMGLNSVWNAEVWNNVYKDVGGYIINAIPHHLENVALPPEPNLNHTGCLALLCEYDTGHRGLKNLSIHDNLFTGVYVSAIAVERFDPYLPSMNNFYNVRIFDNDFASVNQYAVETLYTSIRVDARNNYWGDPTGPEAENNVNGKGVFCGVEVDYRPWFCDESMTSVGYVIADCVKEEPGFPLAQVLGAATGISIFLLGILIGVIVTIVVVVIVATVVTKVVAVRKGVSAQRRLITNIGENPDYGSSVVWQTPESAAETVDLH